MGPDQDLRAFKETVFFEVAPVNITTSPATPQGSLFQHDARDDDYIRETTMLPQGRIYEALDGSFGRKALASFPGSAYHLHQAKWTQ